MNLLRHLQLLWRSKWLIVLGGIVAGALGVLAVFNVSWDGGPKLDWRKPETWAANAKLQITQNGFPDGRGVLPSSARTPETLPTPTNTGTTSASTTTKKKAATTNRSGATKRRSSKSGGRRTSKHAATNTNSTTPASSTLPTVRTRFADPGRLAYLAWIYSHFLMSDEVRGMLPSRPPGMDIEAVPLTAGGNFSSGALPLIFLTTSANTERDAETLSTNASAALQRYLGEQQTRSRVPEAERIGIVTVNASPQATKKSGHPLSVGVVAVLLTLAATLGLVYVLENIRLHRAGSAGLNEPLFAADGRAQSTGDRSGTR